jgi:hypothetical protein
MSIRFLKVFPKSWESFGKFLGDGGIRANLIDQ